MQPTHHVVEVFLPLTANNGDPFAPSLFEHIRDELLAAFGGVTFFSRSPAEGLWAGSGDSISRDQVITAEVLVHELDPAWWTSFRERLESLLEQEEILVRAYAVTKL
jgi:hypothetical protein